MSLFAKIKHRLRSKTSGWFHSFAQGSKLSYLQETLRQSQISNDYLMSIWLQGQPSHPNPLMQFGRKVFSQTDEDGILLEILRRLDIHSGTCVEIGCGDGLENNTLVLLSQGWRTVWIDVSKLAFDSHCNPKKLVHFQEFVTRENVSAIVKKGLSTLDSVRADVVSIDIDGNDGYLAEALLDGGFDPSVLIVEINETLPPPIRFAQPYSPEYVWDHTKNSGWSLQSLADVLEPRGFVCVGCNLHTGVNAFFIRSELKKHFPEVPDNLGDLFVGRSIHPQKYRDHRTSVDAGLVEAIVRAV